MNCREFQEQLFEIVDGTLPSSANRGAEAHLAECRACRELLAEHRSQSAVLTSQFQQRVRAVALSPETRKRILTKLISTAPAEGGSTTKGRVKVAQSFIRPLLEVWSAPVWGWTAAAVVLLGSLLLGRMCQELTSRGRGQSIVQGMSVTLRIPQLVTTYTFSREGQVVTDALVTSPEHNEVLVANHFPSLTAKPAAKDLRL